VYQDVFLLSDRFIELSETSKPKETLDDHMMYFQDLNAKYMPEAGRTSDKRDPWRSGLEPQRRARRLRLLRSQYDNPEWVPARFC
jgi:hypothetical protein